MSDKSIIVVMAIDNRDTVDSVAYESNTLILQLYDHLDFDEEFEYDHMVMLQDKLNTYIWYIDSNQYQDTYPEKEFSNFIINVFFMFEPTGLCKKFLENINLKLSEANIHINYFVEHE